MSKYKLLTKVDHYISSQMLMSAVQVTNVPSINALLKSF